MAALPSIGTMMDRGGGGGEGSSSVEPSRKRLRVSHAVRLFRDMRSFGRGWGGWWGLYILPFRVDSFREGGLRGASGKDHLYGGAIRDTGLHIHTLYPRCTHLHTLTHMPLTDSPSPNQSAPPRTDISHKSDSATYAEPARSDVTATHHARPAPRPTATAHMAPRRTRA